MAEVCHTRDLPAMTGHHAHSVTWLALTGVLVLGLTLGYVVGRRAGAAAGARKRRRGRKTVGLVALIFARGIAATVQQKMPDMRRAVSAPTARTSRQPTRRYAPLPPAPPPPPPRRRRQPVRAGAQMRPQRTRWAGARV